MSRIRGLYPEQWTDEDFVFCSPLARLLALAIRNEADDNGIFPWSPANLRLRLLPNDSCDVAALLQELANSNQVYCYTAKGKAFGIIRNFTHFQDPRNPSFRYPPPQKLPGKGYELNKKYGRATVGVRKECRSPAVALPPELELELELEVEVEGKNTDAIAPAPPIPDPLEGKPKIKNLYEAVLGGIREAHPHARIHKVNSKGWVNERKALLRIIEPKDPKDAYDDVDKVFMAFRWLFTGSHKDAVFWRKQVHAIAPLMVTKKGTTKFGQIYEAWERAEGEKGSAINLAYTNTPADPTD